MRQPNPEEIEMKNGMRTSDRIKDAELLVIEETADSQLDAGSDLVSTTFDWYTERIREAKKNATAATVKKDSDAEKSAQAWRRARGIFFCLAHASVAELDRLVANRIAEEFPGAIGAEIAEKIIGKVA